MNNSTPQMNEPCNAMPANKAEQLFSAIRSVNSIIDHIEGLKDRLGIPCNPRSENESKGPQPTVAILMNEGAGALQQMVQEAHESLEAIERDLL